jgi:hypothetical protein
VATEHPETAAGVVVEAGRPAVAEEFIQTLEEYFAKKRFSNAAAAFEAVKAFVLERIENPSQGTKFPGVILRSGDISE